MRPSTILELAERNGAPVPAGVRDGAFTFDGFEDFVVQYTRSYQCLREPDDFRRIGYEFCEDAAAQGTRYAEVTFSLAGHAHRLGDWRMPVDAVLEGFAAGEAAFGVRCALVLDAIRGVPMELARLTLDAALAYRDVGVVALGLGGLETFPPEPYEALFRAALDGGLHSVPHAGEAAGPASVRGAIEALGAERIGHGIRILEDPELVARVAEARIPLEVCPTSNVVLGIVGSLEEHPLPRLLEAGLVVTLNSDDPSMFRSPLAGEYDVARTVYGLDDAALAGLARAGVEASFADDALKRQLVSDIDAWEATG